MAITVKNNKGFSLVEMMIALIIIALALLALSSVLISSISVNLGNELRNTAIRLTNQTAEILLALPVDSVITCGITPDQNAPHYDASYVYSSSNTCLGTGTDYQRYPNPVQSIKGFRQNFNIIWEVTPLSGDLRQITIIVTYRYRGEDHMNNAVIYKHRTL